VTWVEKGVEEKPDAVCPSLNITTILELTPGSDWARRQFTVAFRALGLPE
jgi:hypothetical protein